MKDDFVDFTLEEKDIRGFRYLIAMGRVAFTRIDTANKREAVRVGCKVLKLLNPIARQIEAEQTTLKEKNHGKHTRAPGCAHA